MKPQRDPRLVIALILLLVAVAFLGGTMRLIRSARAAPVLPVATREPVKYLLDASPNHRESDLIQALTPTEPGKPSLQSADTGGIIALAIVIVVTILLGSVVGVRATTPPKKPLK